MGEKTLRHLTFTCQSCGFQWRSRNYRKCKQCGAVWGLTETAPAPGPLFEMRQGSAGIGVFAREACPAGTLVERCPAYIVCTNAGAVDHGTANNFVDTSRYTHASAIMSVLTEPFAPGALDQRDSPDSIDKLQLMGHMVVPWKRNEMKAIVLGYGMLYNHSDVNWNTIALPYVDPATRRRFLDFTTWRTVEKGDEFLVNYGDRLWFEPRKEVPKEYPPRSADEIARLVTIMDEHEEGTLAMGEPPASEGVMPDSVLVNSARKWKEVMATRAQEGEEDE